jgi:hypothetical protein
MGKLVDSMPKPFHESEVKCLLQQVGLGPVTAVPVLRCAVLSHAVL